METKQDWLSYQRRILNATEQLLPHEARQLSPDITFQAFTQFILYRLDQIRGLREQIAFLEIGA